MLEKIFATYYISHTLHGSGTNYNYYKISKTASALKKDLDIYLKYINQNETNIPDDKIDTVKLNGEDLYITTNECLKYKIATNRFKSWSDLYKRENISQDEKVTLYEALIEDNFYPEEAPE